MNYTTRKGLLTEIACQKAFSDVGILLSQPIISDSRYDYIADIEGKLYRIQCKTSRWINEEKKDAFTFSVSSKNWNNGDRKSYQGQVDFFFTSFEGENYLIPISDVGVSHKTLRLYSETNDSSISWASDYIFSKAIQKIGYKLPDYIFEDDREKGYLENLSLKKDKEKNCCIECGKEISRVATRCVDCYKKIKRENSINIEREVLKMEIRDLPFTSIGKEYNVTDNTIRKWCDKYNLPRKRSDIKRISDEDWEKI